MSNTRVRLHKGLLQKHLQAGVLYQFQIESPDCLAMVMMHNGRKLNMARRNGVYEAVVQLGPGALQVGVILPGQTNLIHHILIYQAE